MYSAENLQHLGPRHEELSRLTWFESLLIARVHPVISVVTLTSTGLLCYAGHVCNYYIKVLEWFKELPAILRDKRWFLVKRRKSLQSTRTETVHKKPTTANRWRLEAGIHAAMKWMPNVYRDAKLNDVSLGRFPAEGEMEMLEEETAVDLDSEVPVKREVFVAWLDVAQGLSDVYAHPSFWGILVLFTLQKGEGVLDRRAG